MTERKYNRTEVFIQYSNAVVPEFDSKGKPDLLGWDDAVASHIPDRDPIATFYSKDYANICMPAINDHHKDIDLRKVYDADDADVYVHHIHDEEEELSTAFFWEEIVNVGNGFSPEDHGWDKDATDKDGNEYLWNEEDLFQQAPKYDDFVKSCQHRLMLELGWCVDPTEMSQEDAVRESVNELNKMMELAVKVYGKRSIYD